MRKGDLVRLFSLPFSLLPFPKSEGYISIFLFLVVFFLILNSKTSVFIPPPIGSLSCLSSKMSILTSFPSLFFYVVNVANVLFHNCI